MQPSPRLKVGQAAPDITLLDTQGQPISLTGFWPSGPTMLEFLRHFG
jgi:peroxiredoxin